METTHGTMHGEHRRWSSDDAAWRDDVDRWTKETERALVALEGLESSLRGHVDELERRREAIGAEERGLGEHEHALAEFEAGGSGDDLLRLARLHQERAEEHARHRRSHESFKSRHREAMADWARLVRALAPTPEPTDASPRKEARLVT